MESLSLCVWADILFLMTEKLSGRKLNVAEVTQSEIGQKQKLQTVLEAVNEMLRPHGWTIEWSVDCEFYIDSSDLLLKLELKFGNS